MGLFAYLPSIVTPRCGAPQPVVGKSTATHKTLFCGAAWRVVVEPNTPGILPRTGIDRPIAYAHQLPSLMNYSSSCSPALHTALPPRHHPLATWTTRPKAIFASCLRCDSSSIAVVPTHHRHIDVGGLGGMCLARWRCPCSRETTFLHRKRWIKRHLMTNDKADHYCQFARARKRKRKCKGRSWRKGNMYPCIETIRTGVKYWNVCETYVNFSEASYMCWVSYRDSIKPHYLSLKHLDHMLNIYLLPYWPWEIKKMLWWLTNSHSRFLFSA
jgi:hypothetical protein